MFEFRFRNINLYEIKMPSGTSDRIEWLSRYLSIKKIRDNPAGKGRYCKNG